MGKPIQILLNYSKILSKNNYNFNLQKWINKININHFCIAQWPLTTITHQFPNGPKIEPILGEGHLAISLLPSSLLLMPEWPIREWAAQKWMNEGEFGWRNLREKDQNSISSSFPSIPFIRLLNLIFFLPAGFFFFIKRSKIFIEASANFQLFFHLNLPLIFNSNI